MPTSNTTRRGKFHRTDFKPVRRNKFKFILPKDDLIEAFAEMTWNQGWYRAVLVKECEPSEGCTQLSLEPLALSWRKSMPDDKSNRAEPDRSRVSANEDYEIVHFAKHHGISRQEARDLIAKHGNSRRELVAAVSSMKGIGQ